MASPKVNHYKDGIELRGFDYTADELRLKMIEIMESSQGGVFSLVLRLGFSSWESFYNYKRDQPEFKNIIDVFMEHLPIDTQEFLYARLKGRRIKPSQSLTKEQRKVRGACNSRLRSAIKGKINTANFETTFGYHQSTLVKHLESKFTEGMNWSNYGLKGWHIDHIKPCSLFNWNEANQAETIKECFAISNLQPLWAMENIFKSNHYVGIIRQ